MRIPRLQFRRTTSPKHISRIVRCAGFPQQRHELLLETPLAVMLGLTRDVIDHDLLLRLTDAKCTIAFLPLKPHSALMEPSRGCCPSILEWLWLMAWQAARVSADGCGLAVPPAGDQRDFLRPGHAGQITTKLDRIGYKIGALFRAKDTMHQHPGMRVRHTRRLSELHRRLQ